MRSGDSRCLKACLPQALLKDFCGARTKNPNTILRQKLVYKQRSAFHVLIRKEVWLAAFVTRSTSMFSMASLPLRPQVIRTQDAPLLHAAPVAAVPSILVGGSTSSQSQSSQSQSIQSRIMPISVASAACLMVTSWRARKRPCIRSQIARQGTLAKPGDSETPSNAVEEWLLSLDLPTPLKPILGSGAWASFAASLVQMFVVAGLSALGTLIEQGESPAFYAQKYPDSSGIILMLGFDHMYSCPLFLGLLAWLAASLIACTGTTQLPLAKRAQRFTFHSSAAMKRRGTFLMRMNCPVVPDKEVPASAERLQQLRTELKSRGFIVRADDEANPTQLAASRGLLGKFAPMAVHLALLLTLLGNTVGLVFGSSSEVLVGDGGYADIGKVLDAGRRIKGPLAVLSPNKGLLDSVFVRVDDFRIEWLDCTEGWIRCTAFVPIGSWLYTILSGTKMMATSTSSIPSLR